MRWLHDFRPVKEFIAAISQPGHTDGRVDGCTYDPLGWRLNSRPGSPRLTRLVGGYPVRVTPQFRTCGINNATCSGDTSHRRMLFQTVPGLKRQILSVACLARRI